MIFVYKHDILEETNFAVITNYYQGKTLEIDSLKRY